MVVIFERRAQPGEDLDRVFDGRFVHVDLLEPAQQSAVLFKVIAEFLIGGGADATDLTARQRGLQQIGGIHRAARRCTGADDGVDLVDEEDGVGQLFKLVDDRLQPLFEIAAIAGAREQRAHVERIDDGFQQDVGHIAFDDLAGEAFGNRGFADAGFAHIKRIVLGPAAQNLDGAVHFRATADQWINLADLGLFIEVDAELLERGFLLALGLGRLFLFLALFIAFRLLLLRHVAAFADAVADEADGIKTAHILLLEEVDGIAFALREQRDEHISAGHFIPARRLDVEDGALNNALKPAGRRRIRFPFEPQRFKLGIEIMGNGVFQLTRIHTAGDHHLRGMDVIDEREEEMLQRRIFVLSACGRAQRIVQGGFQFSGKRWHSNAP